MFGSNSERLIKSWHGFEKPDSEDSGIEEEFEVLDSESQEIPATPCSTSPEDLSLENAILANFPDGCDRSFTVELKDEDSYGIIPKNLTFAEIINILNQAIQEDNCEELDKVVQNIEDYEGRSITLDNENLKDFCSNQLNLELQNRSNHQHIYSNVLSQYKFDQEGFKYDYSVKELVLLAIAANDKLVEQYQDFLFAEENLSLLPLLVGNQKYIEAFIEKFHGTDGVYGRLKGQAIQLVEPNKIGFFSVIALRKEQKLLETVFVEYVLRDFGQVLKTSKPDPLYGVLETASLIKNEEFITIVLDAFERYINEPTKKASTEELLKKSFATLLETAISQERISVIEYLCKRYTNSADHAIYDVYEQAFADDKVITILKQQILKNIGARGRKEIYGLILKTALDAGNIAFIEHLCEKCAECSNDVINYLDHKSKNYESILIALSNVEGASTIINEPSVLSQVVNEKSDDQSENLGLKSAGSKQPQENVVDKEKNTMNNREASIEEAIGNDCEGGKMHSSGQDTKSIEKKLSDAIWDVNFEEVKCLVKQGGKDITQSVLSKALEEANETKVGRSDKKSLGKIKKIREFLTKELKSLDGADVTVPPVDDSTTTSSQVTPVAEPKESKDQEQALVQPTEGTKLQAGENKSEPEGDQKNSPPPSLKSSTDGDESSGSSFSVVDNVPSDDGDADNSNGNCTETPPDFNNGSPFESIDKEEDVPVPESSSPQDTQPKALVHNSEAGGMAIEGDQPVPGSVLPAPTPTLTTPLSHKLEDDAQGTNEQPSSLPSKNNPAPQDTKMHIIAASTLAIAGVALGIAIAVHLQMLAVGIAVGACCLVAAAVIYCCRPKNAFEDNEVKKVDVTQKSTPCCS